VTTRFTHIRKSNRIFCPSSKNAFIKKFYLPGITAAAENINNQAHFTLTQHNMMHAEVHLPQFLANIPDTDLQGL
jgi:hypothetical protein